jgi:hypothetical protein
VKNPSLSPKPQLSPAAYAQAGGWPCIFCKSKNIEAHGPVEVHGGGASQDVECLNCHGKWTDDYGIIGYTVVEYPKGR